jgi:hypothetical protein
MKGRGQEKQPLPAVKAQGILASRTWILNKAAPSTRTGGVHPGLDKAQAPVSFGVLTSPKGTIMSSPTGRSNHVPIPLGSSTNFLTFSFSSTNYSAPLPQGPW